MTEEPADLRNLYEEASAELESAWQKFDEVSAEAQALLLGSAIMQTPSGSGARRRRRRPTTSNTFNST